MNYTPPKRRIIPQEERKKYTKNVMDTVLIVVAKSP